MKKSGEILEGILRKRGISSEEDISEFLSDRPQKTYDPFLLLNMEAGVDLLLSEINSGYVYMEITMLTESPQYAYYHML